MVQDCRGQDEPDPAFGHRAGVLGAQHDAVLNRVDTGGHGERHTGSAVGVR